VKSPEEEWADKRTEIAEQLEMENRLLTNGQRWAREISFWMMLLVGMALLWPIVASQIPA
jgi:hypothetical protein